MSIVEAWRFLTYFDVAASTIFVWDYLLTVGTEVEVVWNAKWSALKVCFLVQRYLPFIDTVWLTLYNELGENLSPDTCRRYFLAAGALTGIGYATSQIILAFRTWAVWKCDRRLSLFLPILYAVCWLPVLPITLISLNTFELAPNMDGCVIVTADELLVISWSLLLLWDTAMFTLMLVAGIRSYREGVHSGLMKAVYRDGLLYYLYLFILSFLNIVSVKVFPTPYQKLLSSMERCIHSILASRVVFQIRTYGPNGDRTKILSATSAEPILTSYVDVENQTRVY